MLRLQAAAVIVMFAAASAQVAQAASGSWRPRTGQRLDIQLTAPYDYARPTDMIVLEPFGTPPERVQQLQDQGVAAVCRVAAGLWGDWRAGAPPLPAAAVGRRPAGWAGGRPGGRPAPHGPA